MAKPIKNKPNPAQNNTDKNNSSKAQSTTVASAAGGSAAEPESSSQFAFISALVTGREVWFLMGAMLLSCFFIFRDFISMEKVYLYKDIGSDSINIYFPWLVQCTEYLKTNGLPGWTFTQGMGQNMFPLWLGDFFSNILMLLNKERLPYALAFMEMLKILLCGFVFFKYLSELKLSRFAASIGAFLFAFCGYIILGSCWTIFSVEALYVAVILYGFERWLNKGKFLWFVLGIASLSFLQPFFLFPYTILLAAYIPVRYNDVHPGEWKKFPIFLMKTLGLSVLAVAISAYQLFPDLLQYIESPRVGGEATLITTLKAQPLFGVTNEILRATTSFRAFGSDMLGTGNDFHGWNNYLEAPLFYCGIFCLVTFPQIFTGLNKSQKIAYGILAGVFALPVLFPYFRYIFWAFTGDYYRTFSFVIALLLLLFTARALDFIVTRKSKVNWIVLVVTVLFLLVLLYTPPQEMEQGVNSGMRSTASLLVILYAALLAGISMKENIRQLSMLLLVVICGMEGIYFSSTTVNDRDIMTSEEIHDRVGYNDYTVDAVKYLNDHDKSFYRITKDYSSGLSRFTSMNDAKVQGYYSTPSYASFNQKNYIKFLGDMEIIDPKNEMATRWARGVQNRPLLMTLTSCKYWLSKKNADFLYNFGYEFVTKFNDVNLYRNKISLPLGFTYDKVLDEDQFKKFSAVQKDVYLLKGCVVGKEDQDLLNSFPKFNPADTALPFNFDTAAQHALALHKDTLNITSFKESHIKGEIATPAPQILFLSIPFDEGWSATVNGADVKLYRIDCGLTGLKLPAGKNKIELNFEPRLMKKGLIVSLISLVVFAGLLFLGMRGSDKMAEVERV